MRPDVQLLPEPSAVMSRSPLPSRWTLLVEFVMVSISPVPKLDPGPVSYFHCAPAPEPDDPLKSSLNWVVQPAGGPGTALGAATADACEVAVVWADAAGTASASTGSAATATPIAALRTIRPGTIRTRPRYRSFPLDSCSPSAHAPACFPSYYKESFLLGRNEHNSTPTGRQ